MEAALNNVAPEVREGIKSFLIRYKPELTVDNFHPRGLKFVDDLMNTVVVVPCTTRDGYFHFQDANADVFVLVQDSVMLGWVHRDNVLRAEIGSDCMMPVGSLGKMPKKGELKFAQECRHLAYHGGYRDNTSHTVCFGCGMEVI